MQVPIEVVFVVVFICFVGDMYRQSQIQYGDYEDGYRQAMEDVANKYNDGLEKGLSETKILNKLYDFLDSKLNGK